MGRKIRDAEKDWVSMIVVFGSKEKESEKLPVRIRSGEIIEYNLEDLINDVKQRSKDFPFMGLTLPRHLGKRPIFRG